MRSHERVPQPARTNRDRHVSTNRRPPALVLISREVHAGTEKGPERSFQAIPPNQPFYVAILAPGTLQQGAVWAGMVLKDRAPRQIEEVLLSSFEPPPQDGPGLKAGERVAEVRRKTADKPESHDDVV